jgi:2',3'-cyclic-nucleotide 2'-phosphodiesterase
VLAIGDVVGSLGRQALQRSLPPLREQYRVDVCIANGENAAGGFGLTAQTAAEMFAAGVDAITSGNHIFDKREVGPFLDESKRVFRPANYPPGVPGRGFGTVVISGVTIGIVNVMGRTFMPPVDDPFRSADACVEKVRSHTPIVIVDIHAEATSEKVALARYLDGRASFIFGTHTHVQTADEQILPSGTAYISDLGMTGPVEGVIGMEQGAVLNRFLFGVAERFSVQKSGPRQFCGAMATIDVASGRASEIRRLFLRDAVASG